MKRNWLNSSCSIPFLFPKLTNCLLGPNCSTYLVTIIVLPRVGRIPAIPHVICETLCLSYCSPQLKKETHGIPMVQVGHDFEILYIIVGNANDACLLDSELNLRPWQKSQQFVTENQHSIYIQAPIKKK